MYRKYTARYNQHTWQWNVVLWERSSQLDAWQGRAVSGYRDQIEAEKEANRLNRLEKK